LLLCIATLTDHKGHTYLLQALPAVLAKFPQVRLMLAGDGELRDALEAETRKLGIAHSVAFLGFRRDVPDLLRAADLFVIPSHMEGLCSTLIDAMFARVPIVATRAGGIPEVLGGDGGTKSLAAKLVPPRDPTALAAAINDALVNLPALREMLDYAEARAARLFTADKMVEGTLAVYEEVLAANRSGDKGSKTRRAA
jgi:glycosyltransferase involved in cell wall biosynthesis